MSDLSKRYFRVRLAVMSPEYLAKNTVLNEADFTAVIDAIVEQQGKISRLTAENAALKQTDEKRADEIRELVKGLNCGAEYWPPMQAVASAVKENAALRTKLEAAEREIA